MNLPKIQIDFEAIKKYLGFYHPEKNYCENRVGKAGDVKRRGDRYISMRQDAEFDVAWLIQDFFNDNIYLTDNERKIAFTCHKRLLDFYRKCNQESQPIKKEVVEEEEFVSRPRND